MKIKCEIIRDLMPSYIDRLTSKESDQMIEEHLSECGECKEYLEEMREEIEVSSQVKKNQKDIKPFQKLKQRTKRKLLLCAAGAVLACGLAVIGGAWYYGQTWSPDKEDVRITIKKSGRIIEVRVSPKEENKWLGLETDWRGEWTETVEIKEGKENPFRKFLYNFAELSFTFLDENTVLSPQGQGKTITDNDVLTLQFADGKEEISLKEMAELAMENALSQSENTAMEYSKDEKGVVTLSFSSELLGVASYVEETGKFAIEVRDFYEEGEGGALPPKGNVYSLVFSDENTILNPDGTKTELEGDETLIIQYGDKKEEIPLKNLVSGEGMEKYQ